MKPRSKKAKGTRLEKWAAAFLADLGLPRSRRQPGSGIYQDFSHDVRADLPDGELLVECKARRDGLRTLDRWLGKADLLIVRADRSPPCFYVPEITMRRLMKLIVKEWK